MKIKMYSVYDRQSTTQFAKSYKETDSAFNLYLLVIAPVHIERVGKKLRADAMERTVGIVESTCEDMNIQYSRIVSNEPDITYILHITKQCIYPPHAHLTFTHPDVVKSLPIVPVFFRLCRKSLATFGKYYYWLQSFDMGMAKCADIVMGKPVIEFDEDVEDESVSEFINDEDIATMEF